MPASLRVGDRGPGRPLWTGRDAAATAMATILVGYTSLGNQQGIWSGDVVGGREQQLYRGFLSRTNCLGG
jgi:hypothetical protein